MGISIVQADNYNQVFQRDSANIMKNGDYAKLYNDVVYIDDRAYVQLRELGAIVSWDNEKQTAIAIKDNKIVSFTIDSKLMFKNNEEISLTAPTRMLDNTTLVTLEAISKALQCSVFWNYDTNTVVVNFND